jgi:protein regulator of cytokinesis 1
MDTPLEEQHQFHHVTCNIAAEEHEVVAEGALSMAVIEQVISSLREADKIDF